MSRNSRPSSASALFEATLNGAADRPFIPPLRHDPDPYDIPPRLEDYRSAEGKYRETRLRKLWEQLPPTNHSQKDGTRTVMPVALTHVDDLTPERATQLRKMYDDELLGRCRNPTSMRDGDPHALEVDWNGFRAYANAKEAELWSIFHDELDLDGNGHLDAGELNAALSKAGLELDPATLADFMAALADSPHSRRISFPEFRDFLLLLPRKASTHEIYQFYKVKKFLGDDGRGAVRVNMEGDVSLSAEDRPPIVKSQVRSTAQVLSLPEPPAVERVDFPLSLGTHQEQDVASTETERGQQDQPRENWLGGEQAVKFLLAGGVAGAVSRTATAPFDRIKVFLITRQLDPADSLKRQGAALVSKPGVIGDISSVTAGGARGIGRAIAHLYAEGGLAAFWVGNGLNIVKIFPESAIKFLSYESSKRFFARYVDKVDDSRDISGTSRFISGGIGGITSQLSIYPIETLKTQMMSATGGKQPVLPAIKRLMAMGGVRAFYRGLTIGLVGVFPYSAIDMSTFEALKLAYLRSTETSEPGVLALLAFGSISGSVGATSVYPLNLVRTRLQASGSSGHPQSYDGILDVARKTMEKEGWRGFYKGLLPTLAKVVPAVSISYVVYEHSKRRLGV
ncbi:putative calcium-dependent carrier protein [Rhizoctonia solani 123E]|uniref:Putative calcium-dependent carrier protein n=1 Tax=Rhizoctonia solani 123E TaxID=1423351 RepID=A0A074S8F3_9AGAM|nr:putative calcium-dependent carrier protein [Rhizoctonia solani 123E]